MTNRFQIGNNAIMETLIRTHPLTNYRASQNPPLSMADLASLLGVVRSTVFRWEKFQRVIDEEILVSVSTKTGIPAKDLRPDLFEKSEQLTRIFSGGEGAQ